MPRSPFTRRHCQISVALVALLSVATPLQASLVWDAQASDYGYLWQYSVAPPIGSQACGPTSTTNAFSFLQNTQGGRIGNQLTGNDYADWLNAANTLASDYMQTGGSGSLHPGTFPGNLTTGMQQYAQHWHEQNPNRAKIQFDGVSFGDKRYDPEHPEKGSFPEWVKLLPDKGPKIGQLYGMLASGAGVVMGMNPGPVGGHIVTLAGMDWNDNNGDGIVDRGEATLSIIDPLDPSSYYGNTEPEPYGSDRLQPQKAALTTLDVWQALAPHPDNPDVSIPALAIEYRQYHGSEFDLSGGHYGPYVSSNYGLTGLYITGAYSMRAVPEPTSIFLWSSLVLGVTLPRRRRA